MRLCDRKKVCQSHNRILLYTRKPGGEKDRSSECTAINALRIFNHEMFGQIWTMTNDRGETFFVGKDVAEALGYSNTTKAIRDHVDFEDKLEERIVLSGQTRKAVVINESGLLLNTNCHELNTN